MRLSESIQSRAVCVALIVNSFVTFVAVGIAAWLAVRPERSCPTVRIVEVGPATIELAAPPPPPAPQWASIVRNFSSEYSASSWSAQQARGYQVCF